MSIDDDSPEAGLMAIALSDSESESQKKPTHEERTGQSEAEFLEVKRTYRVKYQDGEIWKTVQLPLGPRVTKPEAQELLHAVEELYFFGRFSDGKELARRALGGESGLDEDTRKTLSYYEQKCAVKIAAPATNP
ncbi:hypothetical protein F5Y16DRAFT_244257 [Xylariaceae sp. FL0255]|nr:hypothetical protein F5Y16DRAFT_244257 [Xylariaceae sp. FL0255]